MSNREPRNGYIAVTVGLPREVAELLAERQTDLLAIIKILGRECRHLLPTAEAIAEAERLREQKNEERKAEHWALLTPESKGFRRDPPAGPQGRRWVAPLTRRQL